MQLSKTVVIAFQVPLKTVSKKIVFVFVSDIFYTFSLKSLQEFK